MTNAKLKRLINDSVLLSQTRTLDDLEGELREDLSSKQAVLQKIYIGTDKAEIQFGENGTVKEAYFIHPLNTPTTSINYYPEGIELTNDKGERYIQVSDKITVNTINAGDKTLILGYANNGVTAGQTGNFTITSGENSIEINKSLININSPNLRINGLPYEEPAFIDDVGGDADIDELLEYLTERL